MSNDANITNGRKYIIIVKYTGITSRNRNYHIIAYVR